MAKSDKWMLYSVGCLAALLVVCGVCVLAGFIGPFKFLTSGGPILASKEFLKESPVVKEHLGEIKDYGRFPSISVNNVNGEGTARLTFPLKGSKGDGRAEVGLVKHKGKDWEVVAGRLMSGGQEYTLKEGAMPSEAPAEKEPGSEGA